MSAPLPATRQRDRSNRSRRARLARHAPGADVVAEGRRIADRGALVAADQVEPGERTAREILGLQIIDRDLVGDRREHAADQPHVVIPGQPGMQRSLACSSMPCACAREIVEQCVVRDCDAVREAGRSARILQIGDVVGPRAASGSAPVRAASSSKVSQAIAAHCPPGGQLRGHARQLARVKQHRRIGALELDLRLIDIGSAPPNEVGSGSGTGQAPA